MQLINLFTRAIPQKHKIMFIAHQGKIIARYGMRDRIE